MKGDLGSPSSIVLQKYRKDIPSWPSGKKPIGILDLLNEALRRERMRLKSKVKQIKELLLKPETQAKIRRELLEGRSLNSSDQGSDVDFSTALA
uniref:A-kinase anchoring protein 7 n=1 Tax=Equus asinus TaxID=9793 RepID=A0A9L0KIE1_EQUAS